MSKLILLATVTALAGCANALGRGASPADTGFPPLIAACNTAADSSSHQRGAMRACETLAKDGRLFLAEPDAAVAYSRYQQDLKSWQACETRRANALVSGCRIHSEHANEGLARPDQQQLTKGHESATP